jgi:hypothetical protein
MSNRADRRATDIAWLRVSGLTRVAVVAEAEVDSSICRRVGRRRPEDVPGT